MKIIIENFRSTSLTRSIRTITALPDNYTPNTQYHVLYMHDGQNVFDLRYDSSHDWHVNSIIDRESINWIVVATESPKDICARFSLYYPWEINNLENFLPSEKFSTKPVICGGYAQNYIKFLLQELIPYIEKLYSTSSIRALAGSSLGAILSLYTQTQAPAGTFKYLGILSPAMWFDKQRFLNYCRNYNWNLSHIYLSIGDLETSDEKIPEFPKIYIEQALELKEILQTTAASLDFRSYTNSKHIGSCWHKAMYNFIHNHLIAAATVGKKYYDIR